MSKKIEFCLKIFEVFQFNQSKVLNIFKGYYIHGYKYPRKTIITLFLKFYLDTSNFHKGFFF